ncbi:hypothetical protein EJD97_020183 [Solanum chilense]|uniref:Major facilitator superfamily (MFS) profile domain-containing protein n=1 Tax=Solanum chilense TaxID=4083 RepID=A0A6N2C7W9_SOLCI|nr:hypothetical protein EJD97_020183 [Solanum chilense]
MTNIHYLMSSGFNPSLGTILFGILQVGVTAGGALLIDRAGRRPLLMMSASGLLLGSLLIAFSFLCKVNQFLSPLNLLCNLMVLIFVFFSDKAHTLALTLVPNLAFVGVLKVQRHYCNFYNGLHKSSIIIDLQKLYL